jgi:hypothetical protein
LCLEIIFGERQNKAHAPYPAGLLRTCRERPCHRRSAEQRDELAAFHARTLSSEAHTAGLVSMASRVFLHFLQLLLSLNRRLATPSARAM